MRRSAAIAAGIAAVVIVASLATLPPRSEAASRPLFRGAHLPPGVAPIFERACQDCHSERSRFPWYSYVAPVSLLVRRDVVRGREWFNMSRWDEYPLVRKQRLLSEIANQVQDRDMPLKEYTLLHRDARLSDSDISTIFQWTQQERSRLILEAQFGQMPNGRE